MRLSLDPPPGGIDADRVDDLHAEHEHRLALWALDLDLARGAAVARLV